MSDSCTVLIAAPDLLPALRERAARDGGEILPFTDADALRALETIMKRRPQVVALERAFAATPRGAALINRIKADPSLARSDIRVISYDAEPLRTGPVRSTGPQSGTQGAGTAQSGPVDEPVGSASAPVNGDAARRAPHVPIAAGVEVLIDGNAATLVALSAAGAHVLSPTPVKPNLRVRMTLSDEHGMLRMTGTIAWATYEIPHRYRAGIDFIDADAPAVEAYARRHQGK